MMARMIFVQNRLKEKSQMPVNSDDGINYELLALRIREPVFNVLDLLWLKNGSVPRTSDGRLINKNDLAKEFLKEFPDFDSSELEESISLFNEYRKTINYLSSLPVGERLKHLHSYELLVKSMDQRAKVFDRFISRCFDMVKSKSLTEESLLLA